ncbi:hypothetical protein GCM10023184_23620 [Flaviaesturariibacter amylovorans]|uniref:Right-handed parallel beta-helix repeat-containing protein n=1 Tax=Flaviaesturariibacter amylovorans TaxID=1084520 RepID=A0ABP8GXY2_9BACT
MLIALFAAFGAGAQLTGIKNIPGDYPDLAAAVTALNASGVGAGGVKFNVTTAQTTSTGYAITATGTATDSIVFIGNNNTITATGSAASTADAIFSLAGSDYVTIRGFVMTGDNNVEWGVLLGRKNTAAPFDGCVMNVVRDNTISLSKTTVNSTGIYQAHLVPGSSTVLGTTGLVITDAHTGNTFAGNNISNVYLGIVTSGPSVAAAYDNTTLISGNTITNFGGASSGNNVYGIRAQNFGSVTISGNSITNGAGTSVTAYGIQTANGSGGATIANNTVQMTGSGSTTAIYGIGTSGATASQGIFIEGNTVSNCNYTTATTGVFSAIVNVNTTTPGPGTLAIQNNTISANSHSGSGTFYLIDGGVASSVVVLGNTVSNNIKTGANGVLGCIRIDKALSINVSNNQLLNNGIPTTSGSGTPIPSAYGVIVSSNTATAEQYTGNTVTGLSIGGSHTTTNANVYGIFPNATSMGTRTVSRNVVGNLSSTLGGNVYGIYWGQSFDIVTLSSGSISSNRVYDLSGASANSAVSGIYLVSGRLTGVSNNIVGDLRAPAAFANNPVNGINVQGGTTVNVYYNTVYLNATSTGTSFGSSALTASSSSVLDLRNNILINTSTSNGTGRTVAYRRSGTALTGYTGNNNIFFAGTPGAFNNIFYDGTNADETLAAYKARVAPQDAASQTENVPFISTNGAQPGFLHIAATATTAAANGGAPVTGISSDIDQEQRDGTTPDIGADEFSFTTTAIRPVDASLTEAVLFPSIVRGSATLRVHSLRAQRINWLLTDASGRVYQSFSQPLQAGVNTLPLSLQGLPAGSYQLTGSSPRGKAAVVRFVRQ